MRPITSHAIARYVVSAAVFCLAFVLQGPPDGHAQAQGGSGAYVPVDTWREAAVTVPPAAWHTPSGLAVGISGNVYVADSRLKRIEVLDPNGNPMRIIGGAGAAPAMVAPGHLDVDEARDRIYVADPGAGEIIVLSLAGTVVRRWAVPGVSGIATLPDGRLVVTDDADDRVRLLATDGSEVASWGGSGDGPTQYDIPAGVAVQADRVWVADRGNSRVVVTDLSGQAIDTFAMTGDFTSAETLDVAVHEDSAWIATGGGIAPLDADDGRIRGRLGDAPAAAIAASTVGAEWSIWGAMRPGIAAIEAAGPWRWRYGQASGAPDVQVGQPIRVAGLFDGLERLAIGDDGQAYLLDVPHRVQVLALDGTVQAQLETDDPRQAATDPAGNVYVGSGDELIALAPDGTERWRAEIGGRAPGEFTNIAAVDWDDVAAEVVVLDGSAARIHRFAPDGSAIDDRPVPSSRGDVNAAVDLAVADGVRYLLDAGTGELISVDAAGRVERVVELAVSPQRLDVAPDGSVSVLQSDGWVRVWAPDGTERPAFDAARGELGATAPSDVAIDAAGRIYVVDRRADVVTVYEWDPDAVPRMPPQVASGCEIHLDKRAVPGEIALGDTVEILLSVRGACAASRSKLDVAVTFDTSAPRSTFRAARHGLEQLPAMLDPATDRLAPPGGRLSGNAQYVRRSIRRIEPSDGYTLAEELMVAERELFGVRGRRDARKVVIVLLAGTGLPEDAPYWARYRIERAAGAIQRRGGEIFAVGIGPNFEERILVDVADSRDHVIHSRGNWQLLDLFASLAARVRPEGLLQELTIEDVIPDNMDFVDGSARPPTVPSDGVLRWRFTNVGPGGAGARFLLRPTESGRHPTNVRAMASWIDADGAPASGVFPVPEVLVRAPSPTPTAPPTVTATPEPTATRRPTATPSNLVAYLPLTLSERCDPSARPIAVALVLDASRSMADETASGTSTKLEAAVGAAGRLLDRLSPDRDVAAVVAFNAEATLLAAPTGDRQVLDAALAGIELDSGTRIETGIETATRELDDDAVPQDAERAIVLLTDGRNNPTPVEDAIAAARDAQEAGLLVFTIGLGGDVDADALREMASSPDAAHLAGDAEDLAQIYEAIADAIPCPPSQFWGRR